MEGLDDKSGFAGVVIHDMVKQLYWNYQNPKYAGDNTAVEAGGSYMPKWGVCEEEETLLQVIEFFLTTGTAWEGCQWMVTSGD